MKMPLTTWHRGSLCNQCEGGAEFTEEELEAAGLNRSDVHVDFMIGSSQMDIDGIREDGTRVPVFRNGDWAI